MRDQQAVNNMETVWRSLDELCSNLKDGDWRTPTDCPGWSVQDQLSHLVGSECRLLGKPTPNHVPGETGAGRNVYRAAAVPRPQVPSPRAPGGEATPKDDGFLAKKQHIEWLGAPSDLSIWVKGR